MNNELYWIKRVEQVLTNAERMGNPTERELSEAYKIALQEMQHDISNFYSKHFKDGTPTYYDAAKAHRLVTLEKAIAKRLHKLGKIEAGIIGDTLRNVIGDSFLRTIFNIDQFVGVGADFAMIPDKRINDILTYPWSGKNYSNRVWKNKDILENTIKEVLTQGFIQGKSLWSMTRELSAKMEAADTVAKRLLRTEINYVSNQAVLNGYLERGVHKYKIIATLDSRTSEKCQREDGKEYPVIDAVVGKNFPPFHVNCRTVTINAANAQYIKERMARGADGKNYKIPANMTYKEWYAGLSEDDKGKMQFDRKRIYNYSTDVKQYEKYKLIYGKNFPKNLADFQDLKYNKVEEWEVLKANKQDALNALDYSKDMFGRFGDKETRLWYNTHDGNIPNLLDDSQPLKNQAQQAFELRNQHKTQARDMMSDREEAERLNREESLITFEKLLEHKKDKYGLTGDDAYKDIIRSSQTTRKSVNKKLGLE